MGVSQSQEKSKDHKRRQGKTTSPSKAKKDGTRMASNEKKRQLIIKDNGRVNMIMRWDEMQEADHCRMLIESTRITTG